MLRVSIHRQQTENRNSKIIVYDAAFQTLMRAVAQSRTPSVWTRVRGDDWWTTVVPLFTDTMWIENFRMSKETFKYICCRLKPALERMDTNYRHSVPLEKSCHRFVETCYKVKYRSIAHLFGVGLSTACDQMCTDVGVVELHYFWLTLFLTKATNKVNSLSILKQFSQQF